MHLEPQAFDLLVYLVEQRDRVVGKVELLDEVWGHGFLSESNLTTRVKEARRAIGDDGSRQEAIANVRGRGYRFVAAVEVDGVDRPPRRPAALLGRTDDVAAAVQLLGSSPLVTLTGPGGVGKSALARAIAAQAEARRPDGTWIVELAALEPGSGLLSAVARSLDLVADDARGRNTHRAIARLDALVVLDGCEHVVDEVTELVDRLLDVDGSALRIIATSRVRLGSSAETVLPVGPLDPEVARQLFAVRAQAVVPAWDLGAAGPDRVDQLVEALDRLPLTIEMAAARLASMTLVELEEAIHSGASLLQLHHRAPTRRHRSLESVVDWSAALLTAERRAVLEGFSVFAGAVTAADAAAVLDPNDPEHIRPALAGLAEQSLLVPDLSGPAARYSMLATVRAVARRHLADRGAADPMSERHAEHLATALEEVDAQLRTPAEADARARLAGLIDEARAAVRWARARRPDLAERLCLALFQAAHSSLWFEPVDWVAAEPGAELSAEGERGALVLVAGAAAHRGDLGAARAAASVAADGASGRLRAIAVEVLADLALYEGDLAAVGRAARELAQLGQEQDDSHVLAFAAVDSSLARTYDGEPAAALAELEVLAGVTLSPTDTAWTEYARGEALSALGAPDAADHYRQAVQLGSTVSSRFVVSVAQTSLASELARTGDRAGALAAYAEALADFRRHGNHTHALTALRNLAGFLGELGDDRGAVVIASATSADPSRPTYGAEAALIAELLDSVRHRVDDRTWTAWQDEGLALDLDQGLRAAADLVAAQRG